MRKYLRGKETSILLERYSKSQQLRKRPFMRHTWILFKTFTSIHYIQTIKRNLKKQTYRNRWPKKRPQWSINTPKRNPPPTNYRPRTCLPMVSKILTAQIMEIYDSLINRKFFLKQQKGWLKETRETGELLYIDQHRRAKRDAKI